MQSTQLGYNCAWALASAQTQIGAVYAHAEAIQVQHWGRGAAPLNPAARRGHPSCTPHVYILVQGARRKTVDFFPQSLLYVPGDFHTFGPLPERIVLFQVSGTVYDA